MAYDREVDARQQPVSFRRKPAKSGEYYMFYIPKVLIENGYVVPGRPYKVTVQALKEGAAAKPRSDAQEERRGDPLGLRRKKKVGFSCLDDFDSGDGPASG